jgi:hypothetical protein
MPFRDCGPVLCVSEAYESHSRSHCQFLCTDTDFVAFQHRTVRSHARLPRWNEALHPLKIPVSASIPRAAVPTASVVSRHSTPGRVANATGAVANGIMQKVLRGECFSWLNPQSLAAEDAVSSDLFQNPHITEYGIVFEEAEV